MHLEEERDNLERLSEAHVVGEDAAETDFEVLVHPRVAAHLVGAHGRVQVLGEGDFGFAAPGIELLLEFARHVDRDAVAFAGEARLHEFRLRDDRGVVRAFVAFRTRAIFTGIVIARGAFRTRIGAIRAFRAFCAAFNLLADALQVLGAHFHVLRLVFQKPVRILGKFQELFRRHVLVANRHFPVKIEQVVRGKRAETHAPLQAHLGLWLAHVHQVLRDFGLDAENLELFEAILQKLEQHGSLHHDGGGRTVLDVGAHRLERIRDTVQNVQDRKQASVVFFE